MTADIAPEGYHRIALSEFMYNTAAVYWNRIERKYLVFVDGLKIGPIDFPQLEALEHVIKDVIDMKGRYGSI